MPVRWQLIKERPSTVPQSLNSREETGQALLWVFQSFDMGQVTAGFDGIEEIRRRLSGPGRERFHRRELIKRIVDLHRVKELEIVVQPIFRWQFGRIKNLPPV